MYRAAAACIQSTPTHPHTDISVLPETSFITSLRVPGWLRFSKLHCGQIDRWLGCISTGGTIVQVQPGISGLSSRHEPLLSMRIEGNRETECGLRCIVCYFSYQQSTIQSDWEEQFLKQWNVPLIKGVIYLHISFC